MFSLNRKTRYEIIKELIVNTDSNIIKELVINSNFYNQVKSHGFNINQNTDNIEFRREELLNYLDEMEKSWTDQYTDMTDRQFIMIKK